MTVTLQPSHKEGLTRQLSLSSVALNSVISACEKVVCSVRGFSVV